MKTDVVALGELLIDFTAVKDSSPKIFEMHPGGAPANVLAMLGKLGSKCSLISMVGDDQFGDFLIDTLTQRNVDTDHIVKSKQFNTTMAFVHIDERGERSFTFCRKNGADVKLSLSEKNEQLIKNCKIFHCGSLSMTDEPSKSATLKALEIAKKNNIIVSFDPNYRALLWDSEDAAKAEMLTILKYANVVKLSLEELELITGVNEPKGGLKKLQEKTDAKILLLTLGEGGSCGLINNSFVKAPTVKVDVVDTTGCGDAFVGAMLYKLLNAGDRYLLADWYDILKFANSAGTLTATKKGAISALPDIDDIEKFYSRGL